jgi:RHS repeat-associated protein
MKPLFKQNRFATRAARQTANRIAWLKRRLLASLVFAMLLSLPTFCAQAWDDLVFSGTITVVNSSSIETYNSVAVMGITSNGQWENAYWDGTVSRDNFGPGSIGTASGILINRIDTSTGQSEPGWPLSFRAAGLDSLGNPVYSSNVLPYGGPNMTGTLYLGGSCVECSYPGARGIIDSKDIGVRNPQPSCGMPGWEVSEPFISLWLRDQPLGYPPATGPAVSFELAYKQREIYAGFNTNVFSVGKRWACSWLSYVAQYPGQYGTASVVFRSGGGTTTYYSTNFDYATHTQLLGDTNSGFTLFYPDGSADVFGFLVNDAGGAFQQAFLSQRINSRGQKLIFNYSSYQPSAPVIRLDSVVDADGRTNHIYYDSENIYSTNLISRVVDAFGRTAYLGYNSNGDLTNITDVAGNSSSMLYDVQGWVTNLTTPYGTTSFRLLDGPNSIMPDGRSILITRPDNSHELYLYNDNAPGLSSSYPTVPDTSPYTNTFANYWLGHLNTFHWGPRQYAALSTTNISSLTTADYLKARTRHWLMANDPYSPQLGYFVDGTLALEREPSPDAGGTIEGQKTWYDYAGKANPAYAGTQQEPLYIARVLPDGSTSYALTTRNSLGSVLHGYTTSSVGLRRTLFQYDANGIDLLTITNPLGVLVSSNSYNAYHQVLTHYNALGELTTYTYNDAQQLTSVTLPNGLVTTNIYATDHSLSQQITIGFATNIYTYSNDLVATFTDARGLTTGNSWDELNRLTGTQFPDGSHVSNIYTRLDLTATRDRLGNWAYFGYDNLQRNTAITNALGYITRFNYCTCGALESTLDPANHLTSFYYDNQGNLTNTVYSDGYSSQRVLNLLRQVVSTSDSAGHSVTNIYNNQGLLTTLKNAAGTVASCTYDILDRPYIAVDPNGVTVQTTYDDLGRPLTRTYPDTGIESFGYTLNVSGYASHTNQNGNVTQCNYDALGRKTNEVFVGVSTNQFAYDGAGDLLTLTDGRNKVTTWNYDEFGLATNKVDAANVVVFVYQFNTAGQLTNRWTPAKGNTSYSYDPLGNRTNITYGGQSSISFAFDELNRMTNMVDGLGTTRFTYSDAGEFLSAGGLWSGDTVNYSYANRLRSTMTLSDWTNSYSYDAASRLTNLTSTAGSFGYLYDATRLSRVARLLLPNQAYITNTYDPVARLTGTCLKNTANNVLDGYTYTYDQLGLRTNILRDYGLTLSTVSAAYDSIGQLTSWSAQEPNGTLRLHEQLGYGYDPAGNLTRRTNNAFVQTFTVDPANALTNITRSGVLTVSGNTPAPASSITVNRQPAQTYADFTFASSDGFSLADGLNTFTNIATNYFCTAVVTNIVTADLPVSITLQFDANGNLTSDGTRAFNYDSENQLTNITAAGQWKSDFFYDGFNRRRVARDFAWQSGAWVPTNEVRYIYDRTLVVEERDANNSTQVTYTRGLDLSGSLQGTGGIGGLLARTDAIGSAFFHADGNGSITALVDLTGYVGARYTYGAFGNLISKNGALADANLYRFSSKELHPRSGTYYFLYRLYSPELQKWLNRDPIGKAGGINLYGFVGNNALGATDPLGLAYDPHQVRWHHNYPQDFAFEFADIGINIHAAEHGVMIEDGVHKLLHNPDDYLEAWDKFFYENGPLRTRTAEEARAYLAQLVRSDRSLQVMLATGEAATRNYFNAYKKVDEYAKIEAYMAERAGVLTKDGVPISKISGKLGVIGGFFAVAGVFMGSTAFADEMITDLRLYAEDSLSNRPNDDDWAYVELLDMREALNQQLMFSGDVALSELLTYGHKPCKPRK